MSAPRMVTRALVASFLTVAVVLGAVFTVLSFDVRDRVRRSVADNLAAAQAVFTRVEARRLQDMRATVSTLAENPTLKAALDTWLTERGDAGAATTGELLATVQRETRKLAERVSADVLAIADRNGTVVASGGGLAAEWAKGVGIIRPDDIESSVDHAVVVGGSVYRVVAVPLKLGDATIGALVLGTALDVRYAKELADLSRGHAAIMRQGAVLASTLSPVVAADLAANGPVAGRAAQIVDLAGESWAIQPLSRIGDIAFVALASIDAAAAGQTTAALTSLAWIGLGAVSLAGLASVWLARTLTDPIDQLSRSLAAMAPAAERARVPASGSSRELDQLTETFNSLMSSVTAAEAAAEATYLGAVRALAAALDARDSYTAGHSDRVSVLSVAIGHELALDADALETLRLGALLHDIGKIGVPDEVLRKPGALTPAEFESIKAHPSAGARILRSIPFLTPHIPIVELHHERLDGRGYPFGLVGDAIPLVARIVHVADAFDAMTSERAYRSAWLPAAAFAELRRGVGTDFDGPPVEALIAALDHMVQTTEPLDPSAFQWAYRARSA